MPRRAQELQTTVNTARADLSQELGRAPTVAELAARIDVPEDAVVEALDAARAYSGVPLDVLAAPGESVPEHPMLGVVDAGFDQVYLTYMPSFAATAVYHKKAPQPADLQLGKCVPQRRIARIG